MTIPAEPLAIPPGLVAVTGDERTGKTRLLRQLADARPDALWLDLALPGLDAQSPDQVWAALRPRCPHPDDTLLEELVAALDLTDHRHKQLFMLSTGSRRKVALAALLASGATVTCLDQPYAALDAASVRQVRDFLTDVADHPTRSWVVADYVADPQLPWRQVIALD